MFAKIFASVFDSTINEHPPHVFKVWIALLAFAQDEDGIVDMTPKAIANRTELPLPQVMAALSILGEPDPMSRCREQEGRRIVPIPGRPYGWQIVTFSHYRDLKRASDRKEYMRTYMRNRRTADGPPDVGKQPLSTSKHSLGRLADTETETETETLIDGVSVDDLFSERWAKYPKKDGSKEARRHFGATVGTADDLARFDRALANYIERIRVENTKRRYIKNGSTFFNNWTDYVEWAPTQPERTLPAFTA